MPAAPAPDTWIEYGPVSMLTVTAPDEENLMPSVPAAGVIPAVKVLTLSTLYGAAVTIPDDTLPVHVTVVPATVLQGTSGGTIWAKAADGATRVRAPMATEDKRP